MKPEPDTDFFGEEPQPVRSSALTPWAGQERGTVIAVTSALDGEGVSTISRRLALGVGMQPSDCILVDAAIRGADETPIGAQRLRRAGLSDVLLGNAPLESVIELHPSLRLPVLAAGKPTAKASALFASPRFGELLAELRQRYRWVILDTPPAGVTPDAGLIGRQADGVIFVIRAEHTRAEAVTEAQRSVTRAGGQILGAILNRRVHHIPEWLYRRI